MLVCVRSLNRWLILANRRRNAEPLNTVEMHTKPHPTMLETEKRIVHTCPQMPHAAQPVGVMSLKRCFPTNRTISLMTVFPVPAVPVSTMQNSSGSEGITLACASNSAVCA